MKENLKMIKQLSKLKVGDYDPITKTKIIHKEFIPKKIIDLDKMAKESGMSKRKLIKKLDGECKEFFNWVNK